jgi:N-acetylneuraminic acid mutarotase
MNLFLSTVRVHRNDFTNYARAFQFVAQSTGSLATCNWWGSAAGPHDPNADEFVYAPFATEPIAGTTVSCDPGTVGWTFGASMPTARQGAATAAEGGRLYVIGGSTGTGAGNGTVVGSAEAYDPASDSWTTLAPMPSPRFQSHGAAQIGGKIYVAGGRLCSCIPGGNTNSLFIYDVLTNTWSQGPNMPVNGSNGVSAAIDSKLYVLNGYDGGYRTDFWRFDPATASWTQLPSAPSPHVVGAAGVINGKLYVAGGEPLSNRLDVYDPQTNAWTQGADLPVGWQHMGAGTRGSQLFLFGGATSDGTGPNGLSTRAAVYNADQNKWFDLPSLSTPRNVLMGGQINGTLMAIGGATWNLDGSFHATSTVLERIHVN